MCAANANGGYDGRAPRLRLYQAGRSYPPAGVAPIISTTSTIACSGMRSLSPPNNNRGAECNAHRLLLGTADIRK